MRPHPALAHVAVQIYHMGWIAQCSVEEVWVEEGAVLLQEFP